MPENAENIQLTRTTPYVAVVPFYAYAAICLLLATVLLLFSSKELTEHFFQPKLLALTHLMALGWATMIILGASHQLIPVLVEKELASTPLALSTFVLAGLGIPLLSYGFLTFSMGFPVIVGGTLINLAILFYVINLGASIRGKGKTDIHALFIFTASLWLLLTTLLGLLLAMNFTQTLLSKGSLHYLSLHAHLGITGWLLLMVVGVGSKLMPMFMISKFQHPRLLQLIYILINAGIIAFIIQFQYFNGYAYLLPLACITLSLVLFGRYCYQAFKNRIRKKIDLPVRLSLMSVMALMFPLLILFIVSGIYFEGNQQKLVTIYGITIFFGWVTAIIFGMTFKTLPFIVWNELHKKDMNKNLPQDPSLLYSGKSFLYMSIAYIAGLALLVAGVIFSHHQMIKVSAVFLVLAAVLYNKNVWAMLLRKK